MGSKPKKALKPKKSKGRSVKCVYEGIKFDSETEMSYYIHLQGLQRLGEVTDVILQPSRKLQDKFEKHGRRWQAITYAPDFLVTYADGSQVFIDVKMMSTQASDLRRKMFLYHYDIPLLWIARDKSRKHSDVEWLDYDLLCKYRREAKKKAKKAKEESA